MKKILAAILLICLIISLGSTAFAAPAKEFPDLAKGHWAFYYVDQLVRLGAINGMPDGTFAPSRTITRAEFVKIVVGALMPAPREDVPYVITLGQTSVAPASASPAAAVSNGEHWAAGIMKTAEDIKLLDAGEFTLDTWNTPIIRQDMAKIVARAMEFVRKETVINDTDSSTAAITDWEDTCTLCKPYIAQAYAKGIITGYPDGAFGGTRNATRAEASTMIIRLIDPAFRSVLGEISFNPATDIAADGRMQLAKAEEYMMLTLQSLCFYKEGSKFFVKGDLPKLPEGFENWLDISVQFNSGTGLPVAGPRTITFVEDDLIKAEGPFVYEFKGMKDVSQVQVVFLSIGVNALNTTNLDYKKHEGHWAMSSLHKDQVSLIDATQHDKQTNKYYDFSKLFTW